MHRYMSAQADSLSFGTKLTLESMSPSVVLVTSNNTVGTYTVGDSIFVHVIYDIPVKVYGDSLYINMATGNFVRQARFISLLPDKKTLVFKYDVVALDNAPTLNYLTRESLILGSSFVYYDAYFNRTLANTLLPDLKSPYSLTNSKKLNVNTNAPIITSIVVLSPGDNVTYTAGDEIDLAVTFNNMVEVRGAAVLWLQSTPVPLNATARFAPGSPSYLSKRAFPLAVCQIIVNFRFNFPLGIGDNITLDLPNFSTVPSPSNLVRLTLGDYVLRGLLGYGSQS